MHFFKSTSQQPLIGQLLLAHGAGAGSQSAFMQNTATLLAAAGITTWLFDFDYMQRMTAEGGRRPPDRMPKLEVAFNTAIAEVFLSADFDSNLGLYIGGKSMGGRVATHLLSHKGLLEIDDTAYIKGGVILGYPFIPVGKKAIRTEHFAEIGRPTLIVQGQRDVFGGETLITEINLAKLISVRILADGDHSFKPRKASGETLERNMQRMANNVVEWICQPHS